MSEIMVYSSGLCYASVCAPKGTPIAEIETRANISNPTGIGPWRLSKDESFSGGESNPSPCNMHPEERQHYLLEC